MTERKPPALASWMLNWLGYAGQNPSLIGDLAEEFAGGRRSAGWYWRQALMVVWNGMGRNARASRRYLPVVLVGFAAQAAVSAVLWRIGWPREVHGAGSIVLVSAGVLAVFVCLAISKRWAAGQCDSDIRGLISAGGEHAGFRVKLMGSVEVFVQFLAAYCLCRWFTMEFSARGLAVAQGTWLVGFVLIPAVVRVPGARRARG